MRHTISRAWSPWWRATMAAALVGCGGQATVDDGPGPSGGSTGSGGSGGVGAAGGGGSATLTYCEWLDDGNFNVLNDGVCKACIDETLNDPAACGEVQGNPAFFGTECAELTDADAQEALAIDSCAYCDVCGSVCPGFSPHCE